MKMKYLYVILPALLLALQGCNKWLDISPVDEISKGDMYGSTDGFYNVLNGIYQDLGSANLYGQNLSWGAMEAWGRGYSLKSSVSSHETYIALRDLDYTDDGVISLGRTVWLGLYKDIARANEFLQSCEEKDDDFFRYGTVEKHLMMGEALALRAYLHFDLLRIFAQTRAEGAEGRDDAYIPYVEEYPSRVNPPLSSSEVMEKIKRDLKQAADYVSEYDTLNASNRSYVLGSNYRFSSSYEPEWGRFYSQRGCRLNYFAIRALQARVALYDGDYENAKKFAQEILDLVDDKELSLASSSTLSSNPKMMDETLFAFYYDNLIEATQDWFLYTNSQALYVEDYANFTAISSDRRVNLLDSYRLCLAIYNEDKNGDATGYIPAIRLGEVYYIMAEALANTDDVAGAVTMFNTFLKGRGISSATYQIPTDADYDAFYDYLLDDARKEFAGLGQNIFLFKRLNVPIRYSGGDMTTVVGELVMPVPDTESAI